MKKIILTFLMAFSIITCSANITQVQDMEEVFHALKDADSKTFVIFDVDMVLIQPSDPAFQMANIKRFSAASKKILKEVPTEKLAIFFALMTISSDPILINTKIPGFISQLAQRGIPTIALTANLTGSLGSVPKMEQWRVDNLKLLGIDFSQSAPCQTPFVLDDLPSYRDNFSTYLNGILFVNGAAVSKGDAFLAFLEKTGFVPNKVVFIDDREENVKNIEAAIQKINRPIEYLGFHYTGALQYQSEIISEEAFTARWEQLAIQAQEIN